MARLAIAVAALQHASDTVDELVVEAMDTKAATRDEIAHTIGKSREHLRTIRDRVAKRRQ